MSKERDALEAVLLFHSGSPWDDEKRARWRELTGAEEATTAVLCDLVREAQRCNDCDPSFSCWGDAGACRKRKPEAKEHLAHDLPYDCVDEPTIMRTIVHDPEAGSYRECIVAVNALLNGGWACAKGWHLNHDRRHCVVLFRSVAFPSITCPRCNRVSHHPEDVRQRYCGACHAFHDDIRK